MSATILDPVLLAVRFARAIAIISCVDGALFRLVQKAINADNSRRGDAEREMMLVRTRFLQELAYRGALKILTPLGTNIDGLQECIEKLGGIERLESAASAILAGGAEIVDFPPRDPEDGAA